MTTLNVGNYTGSSASFARVRFHFGKHFWESPDDEKPPVAPPVELPPTPPVIPPTVTPPASVVPPIEATTLPPAEPAPQSS